jgi:hypothetical protein
MNEIGEFASTTTTDASPLLARLDREVALPDGQTKRLGDLSLPELEAYIAAEEARLDAEDAAERVAFAAREAAAISIREFTAAAQNRLSRDYGYLERPSPEEVASIVARFNATQLLDTIHEFVEVPNEELLARSDDGEAEFEDADDWTFQKIEDVAADPAVRARALAWQGLRIRAAQRRIDEILAMAAGALS